MIRKVLLIAFFAIVMIMTGCKSDLSNSYPIGIPADTSILDKSISVNNSIQLGNEILLKQTTISKYDGEVYAHDSKLLIMDGIGYCVYYGNDKNTLEGSTGQSIRLSVFDIENPSVRNVYEVFKSGVDYNGTVFDWYKPCYTPVILKTSDGNLRILSMVFIKGIQKYYYRDFNVITHALTTPKICKIQIRDSDELNDFDVNVVNIHLKRLFGNDYNVNSSTICITTEPLIYEDKVYLGLTAGIFTSNWVTDEGTTIVMTTDDEGRSFRLLGAPDPRRIDKKYNRQSVESAIAFSDENTILMLGRNSLGGMVLSKSIDHGLSFSTPKSLNEYCNFNSRATKPNIFNVNGGYLTVWNTKENFVTITDRTVMEFRYGKNPEVCGNEVKIILKSPYGCHYPSVVKYDGKYYLTYTTDTRRLNNNSTGEIVFAKLPI